MSASIVMRPARKADASEIAILCNVATHGGMAAGWRSDREAGETFDPVEIGRLGMLKDDEFSWHNATMAETADTEIVGMMLGYRKADERQDVPQGTPGYLVPILELEEAAFGTWFVSMMGVHFRWRGQGVGGQFLDLADERRSESGARGVSLIVEDANAGARKLYERRGFAVCDQRAMRAYPDGTRPPGTDWLLMVKD